MPLDQDPALVVRGEVGGADHPVAALAAEPLLGAVEQRLRRLRIVLALEEAEPAPAVVLERLEVVVDLGGDAADRPPVAQREEVLGAGVLEERVLPPVQELLALEQQRRHPVGRVAVQAEREPDEPTEVARRMDRPDLERPHGGGQASNADSHRRVQQGARPRARRAAQGRSRGGPPAVLPDAPVARRAGGRDGGRRADHARLEQLPRADRRPARDGGRPRRAGALRDRPHRLAAAQRHARAAPRARARDRGVDGDRGRARLHHRPPGERRHARHDPLARRHGRRRLGRPRLDPRRLPALAGEAAPVPPQPARQARALARACGRGRRRRAGRRRRRLLDGGRRRAAAADLRPLRAARGAADGRRGARRRRARRPRRRHRRAVRGRGPRRPADGHVLEVARVVRRLHRRRRTR